MEAGSDASSSKKRKREALDSAARKKKKQGEKKSTGAHLKRKKPAGGAESGGEWMNKGKAPKSAKERRLAAKEMAEVRKKRRKPNYILTKELALLWEKMRRHDVSKEERSMLVSEAIRKMDGKYLEIAGSHVSARVLQTCLKFCSQKERDVIFDAFRPHLITLARKRYAVHFVKKLLETATKKQVDWFISSLHGQVASLLRHSVGAAVVDQAFHLARGAQKKGLLTELFSKELQLFRDLASTTSGRLVDIISKLGLQKSSVLQYMASLLQPLLEKGIVDYSIVHTAILEYFTIADKGSAAEMIHQLITLTQSSLALNDNEPPSVPGPKKLKGRKLSAEPLLVKMPRTREGLKLGIACFKYGTANERKHMIKSLKGHVHKLAFHQHGFLLLICIFQTVDDTRTVRKFVIQEMKKSLKEMVLDKNGTRPLLHLLHPQSSRYLNPENMACLDYNIPSLSSQDEASGIDKTNSEKNMIQSTDVETSEVSQKGRQFESKKDPYIRRKELLVESGLAESLLETCSANVGEALRSNYGKEILYELALAGGDGILNTLDDQMKALHGVIASEAASSKADDSEDEHVFQNFHSSRIIRKLILDCPAFASTLWETSLRGKCEMWAQGHSGKVITAYLESSDSAVRDLAKHELQPLVDSGILKLPESKSAPKDV